MVPTTDQRVLLIRPKEASERFLKMLGPGARAVISPVIEIESMAFKLDLRPDTALVLTSQNAVHALKDRNLPPLRAYCVGDKTAKAARDLGLEAISAGGAVADLAALIAKTPPSGPLTHIRGEHVAGDLAGELAAHHIQLDAVVAYRQVPVALSKDAISLLKHADRVVIPIFSPRSGALLVEQLTGDMTAKRIAVCLSQSIADGLDPTSFNEISISDEMNAASLRDCVATQLI